MINGTGVGFEYGVALDGYAAEGRSPVEIRQFRDMLRASTRTELNEWYRLYNEMAQVYGTRLVKPKKTPK